MSRPWIPAPDTVKIELLQENRWLGLAFAENVIHVFKTGGWTLPSMTSIGNAVYSWWVTSWRPNVSQYVYLTGIRVTKLDFQSDIVYSVPVPGSDHGNDGGQPLPPQTTFCIKFGSGLTGRSSRGRFFVFGLTSNYVAGIGLVSAGSANAWKNSLVQLRDLYIPEESGASLVITSYRNNKAWRTVAEPFLVTDISYTDLYLDNQRRRALGRGM